MSGLDALLTALLPVTRAIDAATTWLGKRIAWLILAAVLVSAANASVRKIFDTSSNSWLELQWVLFSMVFLLCSPWTLLANEHIRIDIVNNLLPKNVRNSIDVIGHAFFLLPLCLIMTITGIPFFYRSLAINEQSGNAGGLPQWPAKSLIMIGFAFLLVQGLSELIKRIAVMRRPNPRPTRNAGPCPRSRGRTHHRSNREALNGTGRGVSNGSVYHSKYGSDYVLALVMFLLLGYPAAFSLGAVGLIFAIIGIKLGLFVPDFLQALPERVYGVMSNDTLLAIPFFTFMGLVLERSGMAEDLLDTIGQLFGTVRGGLAYAVIFVGALLAATTGVVAASVISMGLDFASDHAALWLRPAGGHRRDCCLRHSGADHTAFARVDRDG